jgi:LysM repeat protein
MFTNQSLTLPQMLLRGAVWSGLALLAACASHRSEVEAPPAAAVVASAPMDATESQTATEAVTDEAPADSETETVMSDAASAVSPTAPKSYVVKRGDTLWGIANLFLKSPWLWPEIWYVNPQIGNPHRIYPGDTVRLANGADGRTQVQITRGAAGNAAKLHPLLRSAPLEGPIATIPYSVIAAFLSRPGVISKDEVTAAPYVLALRDNHVIAGSGNELYIRKLRGDSGARYSVMHVDEPLRDPQGGGLLGYMAIYTGTAQLTQPGTTAKALLLDSARETVQGDVLVTADPGAGGDFIPHSPARPIDGRIIAVVDNVLLAGQFEVVALNRGARDGIERGAVLTVDQAAETVHDDCAHINGFSTCSWGARRAALPTETAGSLLVFKTAERMSYALIMRDTTPIHIGDRVRNP